ncbi:MAG: 1-acyl-sn-glycerol-3-phosphate acyltransferase [Acidobacteriota bacterium]|nr:1-acyl-sn-glycerol-3-phosphate acyltransferase [Acidobacteriota bacterium]
MFESISVPLPVFALLVAGCLYGLVVRPLWRRRSERRNAHAFHEAQGRLAIQPSAFQLLKPTSTADLLMVDPLVQDAILKETERSEADQCDALVDARTYAREIVPSLSAGLYFRIIHGPVKRIMLSLFRVRVRYVDEAAIVQAARTSTPVFVLNHRSNLDYLIAATSLADRAILSFAVGEWARYWPLEGLLRALGGFFVRRGSGNPLYRAVLAAHVKTATRAGVPQAFFIEGRFSEDGRLRRPRLGLLDYAVRAFDPDAGRDVAFVPVAVNYDRVIEDKNLQIMKASGKRATRFGSWRATAAFVGHQVWLRLNRRWKPFGHATLSVGAPVSLREWLRSRDFDPRAVDREERFAEVGVLADDLMRRIADIMPVLPVPLMATVIRDRGDQGVTKTEARVAAFEILETLAARPGEPDIPRDDWEPAVELGVQLLIQRRMVKADKGRLRILEPRRHFVDYYANSIGHLVAERPAAS